MKQIFYVELRYLFWGEAKIVNINMVLILVYYEYKKYEFHGKF